MATKKAPLFSTSTDEDAVREHIKARIVEKYGSVSEYARRAELSHSYAWGMLNGVKPLSPKVLKHFGIKKEVITTFTSRRAA